MKGLIGANNIDTNSRLCMSSAVAAHKRAFGEDIVPASYQDFEQTFEPGLQIFRQKLKHFAICLSINLGTIHFKKL